jgi:hypothetical protein
MAYEIQLSFLPLQEPLPTLRIFCRERAPSEKSPSELEADENRLGANLLELVALGNFGVRHLLLVPYRAGPAWTG